MKKNSMLTGLIAEVLDELKNEEMMETTSVDGTEDLNSDPNIQEQKEEIANEEVKEELSDSEPKNYNFLGIDIVINTDEEGKQVITFTKDDFTITKEVENVDFQNIITSLQDYIVALHEKNDGMGEEEETENLEENSENPSEMDEEMPELDEDLTEEEKQLAMESHRLIANIYKSNKNKLIEMAKLGYSFKKYVLANLREELFANNIKGYIEKNKDVDTKIAMAQERQSEVKKNYLLAKNMNQDLRKKYVILSNILSETKKAFASGNSVDKNKIKMVLSYVVKGMDLDTQKFSILAQKSQKAITSILAGEQKTKTENSKNSEIKNEEGKKSPITASNRKPNLQTNGGYGRSTSTLKEQNDGTDEMMIELKKLISPKY
jgi:hypothetical protein